MEDETLANVLNLLQSANGNNKQSNQTNTQKTINNDLQSLIIKFLLSGGLTQILNFFSQRNANNENTEKTRTIDLKNYQNSQL